MADKNAPNSKRNLIDKANATVVASTAAACFIVVFSLVACNTLFSQLTYQNRVIKADRQTLSKLKQDLSAVSQLENSYKAFVGTPTNVLGGNPTGSGAQDGDNAKITLDALPGQYDFPALATSLQSLLASQGVQIQSISGTDDEVAQDTGPSNNPSAVAIPFQVGVSGSYQSIQNVMQAFDHSIRPIQIQTMNLSGDQADLTLSLTAQTFYQPAKSLNLGTETIK